MRSRLFAGVLVAVALTLVAVDTVAAADLTIMSSNNRRAVVNLNENTRTVTVRILDPLGNTVTTTPLFKATNRRTGAETTGEGSITLAPGDNYTVVATVRKRGGRRRAIVETVTFSVNVPRGQTPTLGR